jgi:hypothetical protein
MIAPSTITTAASATNATTPITNDIAIAMAPITTTNTFANGLLPGSWLFLKLAFTRDLHPQYVCKTLQTRSSMLRLHHSIVRIIVAPGHHPEATRRPRNVASYQMVTQTVAVALSSRPENRTFDGLPNIAAASGNNLWEPILWANTKQLDSCCKTRYISVNL